jgi:DNA primase
MHEIELELNHLDESLDFALEFEGARTQLTEMVQQGLEVKLMNQIKEKPLSALSLEEREMLKKLTTKAIS